MTEGRPAVSSPGTPGPIKVLFVCTHNSARSIMAEALLRDRGGSRYAVYSAGTEPARIRPLTLRVLEDAGLSTASLRSKSVEELMDRRFDHVVTVCDSARESCPTFPGEVRRLHWSLPDPATLAGNEAARLVGFRDVFSQIGERIDSFIENPL